MPRIIVTQSASLGLERCRLFLAEKNPQVAKRAAIVIEQQLLLLETHPAMGRPLTEQPDLRELLISFGSSGYVALYRHELSSGLVYILAFRHQKEAGY